MPNRPGDFRFTDGDRVGMVVNGGGAEGQPVAVTGSNTVSTVATHDADYHGVLTEDCDDGDKVTIAFKGVVAVSAYAGTTAGSWLTPDAGGALRGLNMNGQTGEDAMPRKAFALTDEENGMLYARLP